MPLFEQRRNRRKPLGAEQRTNKLNPHMTPDLGIEPGSHWWEASALTTAPSLHKEITSENTGKCWHTLRDWCFVINTAQLFCNNDRISYPINSTEGQPVMLAFTGFCRFMKGVAKQNIIFLALNILYSFYWYIVCVGFLESRTSTNFFLKDTRLGLQ